MLSAADLVTAGAAVPGCLAARQKVKPIQAVHAQSSECMHLALGHHVKFLEAPLLKGKKQKFIAPSLGFINCDVLCETAVPGLQVADLH